MIMLYASYGYYAKDTNSFLYSLVLLAISFILGSIIASSRIKDKEKLFLDKPQEKIKYHMFYRRAVYPVLLIQIFIISIITSGVFDFPEIVKVILQVVVFALLYIFLNGLIFLMEEYRRSNYNYILYRASIRAATLSQNDDVNRYFLLGLKQFDKHLRRKFGLAINGIDDIFSRYVLLEREDRSKLFTSLLSTEKDSLASLGVLNKSLEISGNILTKVSNMQKIKDLSTFLVPIVAIVISFIHLLLSIK